jgi:hypothetical protein
LQRLTDRPDAGIVLRKGFFKTIDWSYLRNRDAVYYESTEWPAQVCIDIQNGNVVHLNSQPSNTSAPIFQVPDDFQMIIFLLTMIRNFFRRLYGLLFFHQKWNIGIVNDPIHVFLSKGFRAQVRWLPAPPEHRFSADPFAVRLEGVLHILFEDYNYRTSRGCISAIATNDDSFSLLRGVIERAHHLSYPFLLEHEDQIYCVPESYQDNEVSLYKATQFPSRWVKVASLVIDFCGLDSTVFQYEGRWWLFATDESDGPDHKLKVWHAPGLLGPWRPHAANPVKMDIRSARSAGTPFVYDGHLYRPSQDCSESYGKRVVINRVTRLTPTEFREEQISVVNADERGPYPDGLHTISAAGNLTVVDGLRNVFVGKDLLGLTYKMREILILLRRKTCATRSGS